MVQGAWCMRCVRRQFVSTGQPCTAHTMKKPPFRSGQPVHARASHEKRRNIQHKGRAEARHTPWLSTRQAGHCHRQAAVRHKSVPLSCNAGCFQNGHSILLGARCQRSSHAMPCICSYEHKSCAPQYRYRIPPYPYMPLRSVMPAFAFAQWLPSSSTRQALINSDRSRGGAREVESVDLVRWRQGLSQKRKRVCGRRDITHITAGTAVPFVTTLSHVQHTVCSQPVQPGLFILSDSKLEAWRACGRASVPSVRWLAGVSR